MARADDLGDLLAKLNRIGIALSSERTLTALLELILRESRQFANAEGGSLYLREGDKLSFLLSQNDVLSQRYGKGNTAKYFLGSQIPLAKTSLAGYVAVTGETLNLEDAYAIPPEREYGFNTDFDHKNQYRTRSVLVVPMRDPEGRITGVLSLINARDEQGAVIPFHARFESLMASLASQAAVAIRNARLTQELKDAYLDTITRLSVAAEYRDDDTATHLQRMSLYAQIVAETLGFSQEESERLRYAAIMHDVGKIGVPDAILLKPGKLSPEEFEEMKKHTVIGAKILGKAQSDILRLSETIALTHHEKWDGTGYPRKLAGEAIPLPGRITAVADVFDALTSRRCYKPPFSSEQAISIIREGSGKHFDPRVVEAFLASLDAVLKVKAQYSE
ncbi:MAG: HD domain-containing protein [Planctomycetes bacterium]|nr:HD domain-containing protein [Planctomycetota bacterium]